MSPRLAFIICLVIATCATTVADAEPAVWSPHELIVDLHDLPRHYTCNDLWYKFKGILYVLGARQDMEILPYRCEGNSPAVQLKFATPRLVTGPDAHWSELSAVARTVKIAPGSPATLDSGDCQLLSQIEGSLLKFLGSQVESSRLQCKASTEAGKPVFDITAKVLLPMAEASLPTGAHITNESFTVGWVCDRGFKRSLDQCAPVRVPEHGFLAASGHEWKCDRGYVRA